MSGKLLFQNLFKRENLANSMEKKKIHFWNLPALTRFVLDKNLTEGSKFLKLKKIMEGGKKLVKPKKILLLGSGALKIGEAGESLSGC